MQNIGPKGNIPSYADIFYYSNIFLETSLYRLMEANKSSE